MAGFDRAACGRRLAEGAALMGLVLEDDKQQQLLDYLALMHKWNKAFNLTAVRDPLEMVSRHLLDSLVLLAYLQGERCLDMGTGPGLPGIPLAIMRPDMQFTLLDSNSKKVRFLRQVVMELGLDHCHPLHSRLEAYRSQAPFQVLTARAVSTLSELLDVSRHLRDRESLLLAMKGRNPQQELDELSADYVCHVMPLSVPFTDGERCLVSVREPEKVENSL
ncbi:MAG: 16S rRNA (guanine(527)-N(7))-methyltransferase RsmG [Candidatus Thiodiazotropha lotti]|nr:16S rRNA (guanine(527)-N(7))-methyltransferase RsmG [Candidatus Thiodiazotropha lotti]MCG8000944.1 16S rRNA (guanine(527)-N(7))-methyltransferase RsmG [Candidatus Thiodiazotropha lotti]MCW4183118.1 16S rRNA (guanine(527)-N(7))-methyltransferase RsmG [Candidatus Thiodiazotropha weberae]MCW4192717.1 16S rRNA (guanine(527)-N(7))-methyltransferase RsmG [Candidatus Thiodiazotropha weberae]